MMMAAEIHARALTQIRLAKGPMRPRSLVKWISGMMANGSCMLRTHLAERRSPSVDLVAGKINSQGGGNDGERARDHAPQPGPHADIEETFHHHLSGEGSGERGGLARAEQGDREDDAGEAGMHQRRQQHIRLLNFGHAMCCWKNTAADITRIAIFTNIAPLSATAESIRL